MTSLSWLDCYHRSTILEKFFIDSQFLLEIFLQRVGQLGSSAAFSVEASVTGTEHLSDIIIGSRTRFKERVSQQTPNPRPRTQTKEKM